MDAENRDWGTWKYFNSVGTRVPADWSQNPLEAGHLKKGGDAETGHPEVLNDTGASASKDQLGALFQTKKNLLLYFIILTGLSISLARKIHIVLLFIGIRRIPCGLAK